MIAPAIALDGRLTIVDATGHLRTETVDAFVLGARTCNLTEDEIVTGIEIPLATDTDGSCHAKYGRVAQDRATLGLAVWVSLDSAGKLAGARIVIGGITPRPTRLTTIEAALVDETGEVAAAGVEVQTDELATATYRTQLIRVMLPECLKTALNRAGSGQ